jgi:hypothetical protein
MRAHDAVNNLDSGWLIRGRWTTGPQSTRFARGGHVLTGTHSSWHDGQDASRPELYCATLVAPRELMRTRPDRKLGRVLLCFRRLSAIEQRLACVGIDVDCHWALRHPSAVSTTFDNRGCRVSVNICLNPRPLALPHIRRTRLKCERVFPPASAPSPPQLKIQPKLSI